MGMMIWQNDSSKFILQNQAISIIALLLRATKIATDEVPLNRLAVIP
jgi:hypothetical protein